MEDKEWRLKRRLGDVCKVRGEGKSSQTATQLFIENEANVGSHLWLVIIRKWESQDNYMKHYDPFQKQLL